MKSLVIGLGKSGKAAAHFLLAKGDRVFGVDRAPTQIDGITLFQENQWPEDQEIDRAILSPGIPLTHPLVQKLKSRGIPVIGEVELAFQFIQQPCFGITGTNGKTTATSLLAHVLSRSGRPTRALGNNGFPLTEYLLNPNPDEMLVIELSSFQIETLRTAKLDGAAILNITPDHLDRYDTFDDYGKTKCQIVQSIKKGGPLFICEKAKKRFEKYFDGIETIVFGEECTQPVAIISKYMGIDDFERCASDFKKPPHRLELIRELSGVQYINDSKATNVESVLFALKQFEGNLWLIVGGRDKEGDFSLWKEPFSCKVKGAFGYGEAALKIEKALQGCVPYKRFVTMKEALLAAHHVAQAGDKVLLCPGCASFDAFKNYEERGDIFKQIVNQLN